MRFESKYQVFKQLVVKPHNFKTVLHTLSNRNQLDQYLLLSSSNHYSLVNSGCSLSAGEFHTLPIDIRKLLETRVEHFDHTTKIMGYQRLKYNHVALIKGSAFVDNAMHEEIPSFRDLVFMFKINDVWLLIVEQLETIAFNESLWSYELGHTNLSSVKQPNKLIHIQPKGVDIYEIGKKILC